MKTIIIFLVICSIIMILSGCEKLTEPEKLRPYYTGKWMLTEINPSDSNVVKQNTFLTLNDDDTFICTSTLFWAKDSTKYLSCQGSWNVSEYYIDPSRGVTSNRITFTKDSVSKGWDIRGDNKQGSIYLWDNLPVTYWILSK